MSLPKFSLEDVSMNGKSLEKEDIQKLGFIVSEYSSLEVLNSSKRLDTSFLFEKQSYVQDKYVLKGILESAYDKKKGLIIFENNGEFQKHLKSKNIDYAYYNSQNIKIQFSDLSEKVLLDTLALSNREQSVIASFINFREANKECSEKGLAILDGSSWMYDFFLIEASSIAQQFKVNEYSVKMLKTSLLKLYKNKMMSKEYSNINEILKSTQNGKITLIDIDDSDKKFLKAILSHNSQTNILMVDNTYDKFGNVKYMLYDSVLKDDMYKEFSSFIVNKNSFMLKDKIVDIHTFAEEFLRLDFEYLVIKENSFPILIESKEHKQSNTLKDINIKKTSTVQFF
ncbi:hypothetical protein ACV3V0_05905 [Clostridium perfringens]